jgi:hypothetical protein
MKRIRLVTVAALSLMTLAIVPSQSNPQNRKTTTAPQGTLNIAVVPTQQRINRYFHGSVIPRLNTCWSSLQGKGTIALKYTFTKSGARWTLKSEESEQSTLPSGQDAIALRCMRDAVRGSSFPVDRGESTQTTFVVNWNWPVPFPANASQLATRMFAAPANGGGGGGGGCDGLGSSKKCYVCKKEATVVKCELVCVGYATCVLVAQKGSGACNVSGACASGGPFGVSGGSVIY